MASFFSFPENKDNNDDFRLFKLAFGHRSHEELYELKADPDQLNNLALKLKGSDVMKEIRAHCVKLIAESGQP